MTVLSPPRTRTTAVGGPKLLLISASSRASLSPRSVYGWISSAPGSSGSAFRTTYPLAPVAMSVNANKSAGQPRDLAPDREEMPRVVMKIVLPLALIVS